MPESNASTLAESDHGALRDLRLQTEEEASLLPEEIRNPGKGSVTAADRLLQGPWEWAVCRAKAALIRRISLELEPEEGLPDAPDVGRLGRSLLKFAR